MDLGVAMRTNAGRAPERAVKYGNSGRTAVITAHMVPGVTFKQSSLSGEAHVRDGSKVGNGQLRQPRQL